MVVSRRDFIKISGSTVLLGSLGINLDPARAYAQGLRIKDAKETKTICPYCSVGCGIIVHTKDGKVINTEGDPEHPINEGTLCSKGASLYQIMNNPAAAHEAEISCSRRNGMEGSGMGLGAGRDRQAGQRHPRQDLQAHLEVEGERKSSLTARKRSGKGVHGQQDRRHRPRGQRGPGQRRVLYAPEDAPVLGPGLYRTPGANLTLRNCSGSGRVVRTRCNDESLDRSQEC